ncbi:hypothetical protein FS320_44085, partial [Microvirga tunisiensis]|nr:hypothetical protein [Microvirga tunisiensis]
MPPPSRQSASVGAVRRSFAPWSDPDAKPLIRFENVTKQTVCSLPVEVARPKLCDERGLRWMGRRRASRTGDEPCSRRA